jgi:hypothetical protein
MKKTRPINEAISLRVMAVIICAMLLPASARSVDFTKVVLDEQFRAEGVAVADINQDGKKDVFAGSMVYVAPDWRPVAIRPAKTFDGATEYSDCFYNFAMDVDQDGWTDSIIVEMMGQRCFWYENPGELGPHWTQHTLWSSINNECPALVDLWNEGTKVFVFASQPEAQFGWFTPAPDPADAWLMHPISDKNAPGTDKYSHGMGIGDINGDGRKDLLIRDGWWEQPASKTDTPWTFHPASGLGPDCAHMFIADLDGDGDSDVVSSSAHQFGVWWYERQQAASGEPTRFTQHVITGDFSQTHALCGADINQDGIPDFVTGKRYLAHMGRDPGADQPPVLLWFEGRRENGSVRFIPHVIDDQSGVGTQFEIADVDDNTLPDIAVANKNGVFLFLQEAE